MAFRDETEQLRARVAELEGELADAHDTIARLTGATSSSDDSLDSRNGLLDAPGFVKRVRLLDHELDDEGLEAVAAVLRQRTGAVVQQVGRTLSAPGVNVESKDGLTRIEVSGDLSGFTLTALAATTLGGAFSGLTAFALAHDLWLHALSEAHALWMVPLMMALLWLPSRAFARRLAERNAKRVVATFEAVCEAAARHPAKPKVRVATDESEEEVVEVEAAGSGAATR